MQYAPAMRGCADNDKKSRASDWAIALFKLLLPRLLVAVLWFTPLAVLACGDTTPDPATVPPVVRVLAI